MPDAVDLRPDLDTATTNLRRRLDSATLPDGFAIAVARDDLRLVLDALADYRARRATGGPPPPFTHTWGNVDSRPETAPGEDGVCPVGCPKLCTKCQEIAGGHR